MRATAASRSGSSCCLSPLFSRCWPRFARGRRHFSAPIRTGWIFLHIVLLLAAYGALVVSLLASLLYLIQERRLKSKAGQHRWLPPLDTPLEAIDQIARKTQIGRAHV